MPIPIYQPPPLAASFEGPGKVAPDGTIWLDVNSRLNVGVALVSEEEAKKAAPIGWREIARCRRSMVKVERKGP
jgi:hypothetical protein